MRPRREDSDAGEREIGDRPARTSARSSDTDGGPGRTDCENRRSSRKSRRVASDGSSSSARHTGALVRALYCPN